MTVQLAFPEPVAVESSAPTEEVVLKVARAAIDLKRFPGYREFTDGTVLVEQSDSRSVVLATDNRWAASAIRTALLDAGYAVEGDPLLESTTVTAWAIATSDEEALPELKLVKLSARDQLGVLFLLEGPDGAVEQQCGGNGHNNLVVHALHPFPGATRIDCTHHTARCWQRYAWPLAKRVRHLLHSSVTESGEEWQASPQTEQRMRDLYLRYIQQTRPQH